MSSSNRTAVPCDAAIYRDDHPVGPMRLPIKEPASFVEEFNRLYRRAGIVIERFERSAASCNPDKKG
ncbi:hypothetical protein [Stieleria mannarensis]|uniref:hypothetical protein n=1 Tax=Stieleria mannarensis TaxID=2755585 RepID=UPI0016045A51|nr:hypothetical protein [Rhodopirellula sp. JC639]